MILYIKSWEVSDVWHINFASLTHNSVKRLLGSSFIVPWTVFFLRQLRFGSVILQSRSVSLMRQPIVCVYSREAAFLFFFLWRNKFCIDWPLLAALLVVIALHATRTSARTELREHFQLCIWVYVILIAVYSELIFITSSLQETHGHFSWKLVHKVMGSSWKETMGSVRRKSGKS